MYVEFTVPTATAVINNEPTGFGPAPPTCKRVDAQRADFSRIGNVPKSDALKITRTVH